MPFGFQDAYDELNPADDDYRFYLRLAQERGARSVVDLGCGTGTLARLLAEHGIDVLAVDPDPEMLRVARAKRLIRALAAASSGGWATVRRWARPGPTSR